MSEWIDELRDSVAKEKRQKEDDEESQRRNEATIRNTISQVFHELEKGIQPTITTLNQKIYEGRREVVFRYIDNMITGDHFLITLRYLRFYVRVNFQESRIECKLESYFPQREKFIPVNGGSEDIFVITNGDDIFLEHREQCELITQIEQISQKLLSTIVRVAET